VYIINSLQLDRISNTLFDTIKSPILRHNLISSLPHTAPRTHLFRRRLALAFALDTPRHLNASMSNPALTAHVLLHLSNHPVYQMTNKSDYVVLGATIKTLDVGIDCGFSDFSFLQEPETEDQETRQLRKKQGAEFNTGIDMMVSQVKTITSRIVAGGAKHMVRLEAKAAAERLAQRLEFAVRTTEKKRKDWYGEDEDSVRREFMENWVEKGRDENIVNELA
jgi:hypothetical protein